MFVNYLAANCANLRESCFGVFCFFSHGLLGFGKIELGFLGLYEFSV